MECVLLDEGYQKLPGALEAELNVASGLENEHGLRIRFFGKDEHVVGIVNVPSHMCGWKNMVHGGIVTTMLDDAMGWAIIFVLKKFMLTKSITVNYFKPAHTNQPLTLKSSVHEIIDDREVKMKARVYNEDGDLCTEAIGTFAVFTHEIARRLPMVDTELVDEFFNIIGSIKN